MGLLSGKVAIVAGASSGIGRSIATRFAQEGAAIVLVARRSERLDQLAQEIENAGGSATPVTGDVIDFATHEQAVATALQKYGGLDVAINNAGLVGQMCPLAELSLAEWSQVLAVNLTGSFLGAKAQIPAMLSTGGGSLVFTGSFVGVSTGLPGMGAYGSAKAGLLGLVRSITADYSAKGIRANALLPGGTATEMAGDETQREWAAGLHAMKRIAEPDEIANAALFLASELASFVTGSALWADGGNSAVKL